MPDPTYFKNLEDLLKGKGVGRPCILLDLDRLDDNLARITGLLGPDRLRVVTKSLPSRALLQYILQKTESNRLMAFHLPQVHWMLEAFGAIDILLGKPFLGVAIDEFLDASSDKIHAASNIQWLVDTEERLFEHIAIAKKHEVSLAISLEIDIGLHRGGINTHDQLAHLINLINQHPRHLRLSGLMGYEAHVPHYPDPAAAFERSIEHYAGFITIAQSLAAAQDRQLTFNSGGSSTFFRFADETRITDVSLGSAIVKPAAFERLEHLQPALHIAAPVIRKFPTVSSKATPTEHAVSIYLYGGGWAAKTVYPQTIVISPSADPPNQNLMPNQSLYFTNSDTPLGIGDFVFFQPIQSDAMFQFEEIITLRDGVVDDVWRASTPRY